MKKKIITNIKELRKPSQIIEDKEEINAIIKDLEDSLDLASGMGLCAMQIGIPKKVGIVRFKDFKLDLINPKVLEKEGKFRFRREGCLSIPSVYVDTIRYRDLIIENNGKKLYFSTDVDGLVAIAVLHEIRHMQGYTILDDKWKRRK